MFDDVSFPGRSGRLEQAWPTTVEALPVGTPITGTVLGRRPFGVFILIDGFPDAVGLARINHLPRDAELPRPDTPVAGEVAWHDDRNHQVGLRVNWSIGQDG